MPSTYTANNGIEKIGTGEQSGTWGSTTNTNFDIIDRAINGVGSISLSGTSHTLTTSDGTASDGHFKVLVLGGSPTGTNTVTITPNDQDKLYFVHNTTGQTATFTQGSGSNASILAGKSGVIYADGAGAGAAVVNLSDVLPVVDDTITTTKIANDAVTNAKLADDAVDSAQIADGAIDTVHIADDQVTNAKLADDAVDSAQIADGAIDTVHIADAQVTNAKLATDAVTNAKVANNAIDTAEIVDGAVTSAKMATTTNGFGTRTVSTSDPSGGSNGDVWYKYDA